MENVSLKTIPKSSTRWDASTYESSYIEAVRLISQGTVPSIVEMINLPKDANVLGLGIGSGKWECAFSIMGYKVTGIDNNPEMLEQVKRNFPNIKIELVEDELPDLKSEASKRKYELVFSEGLIEHFLGIDERIATIRAHANCCVADGYVYFLVPFLSDKPDEHRYTSIREMENEIRKAGLKPVIVDTVTFYTSTKTYVMLRVFAKKVVL